MTGSSLILTRELDAGSMSLDLNGSSYGSSRSFLGGTMEALANLGSGINWEAIAQLTLVGLIMLSGPVVIFVLAFRGGDL
jgi:hypothetical protein